jgi:ribosome biogenesis GTPase A
MSKYPFPVHFNAINWYPGHMAKGLREMKQRMRNVDMILEVRDARIPYSSMHPAFSTLFNTKDRLILLNKHDLADPSMSKVRLPFNMWKILIENVFLPQ